MTGRYRTNRSPHLIFRVAIKVMLPRSLSSTYHKDSLKLLQRERMLKVTKSTRDRAVLALMTWNGLSLSGSVAHERARCEAASRKVAGMGQRQE